MTAAPPIFAVFMGSHFPRLDDKGRLFLPAKFRERLKSGLVITRGQDRSLFGYPAEEFERSVSAYMSASTTGKAARDDLLVLLSGAETLVPDRQGRITIPPRLREYAGLRKDCAVIGSGNKIEFWDSQAWENFISAAEETYSERVEEVIPGMF